MLRRLGDTCRDVMLQIALHQSDPAERRAMLEIMHRDGLLTPAEITAYGLGKAA